MGQAVVAYWEDLFWEKKNFSIQIVFLKALSDVFSNIYIECEQGIDNNGQAFT